MFKETLNSKGKYKKVFNDSLTGNIFTFFNIYLDKQFIFDNYEPPFKI